MNEPYRIEDEPLPSSLDKSAVNPLFPLLGLMFGGAWLAWPWFAFNAAAMGSPTRKREWQIVAGALLGSMVLALLVIWADREHVVSTYTVRFAILGLQVWKLGCAYKLQTMQSRTFELFEYYGGTPRNGLVLVIASSLLRSVVLGLVEGNLFLLLVLA